MTATDEKNNVASEGRGKRKSSVRSKTGCLTCRKKRVKCDEAKPVCNRCQRLALECGWAKDGGPSLRGRRMGLGPLKSRSTEVWRPEFILPATLQEQSGHSTDDSLCVSPEETSCPDLFPAVDKLDDLLHFPGRDLSWLLDTSPVTEDPALYIDTGHKLSNDGSRIPQELLGPRSPPLLNSSLSSQDLSLPINFWNPGASVIVSSPLDERAIEYYALQFSPVQITKHFAWSTNALLLQLGYQEAMVMRFMLATSLNELYRRGSNSELELKERAEFHFQAGCSLFSALITSSDNCLTNHVVLLASAFFSYLYLSRRRCVDRSRLQSLSRLISDYVRTHNLDLAEVPVGDANNLFHELATGKDSSSQRGLLVRLIRWNFFKDVQMCFHGCGGSLASHIIVSGAQCGRASAEPHSLVAGVWGSKYPDSEIIDDLQNSLTADCLYHIFTIMQDVNQLPSVTQDNDRLEKIGRELHKVEMTYQSLFQLSMSRVSPRTPVLLNIDLTIARFHATRIYYFRSTVVIDTQCPLGEKTPAFVQKSLSHILALAHGTFASGLANPYERLQWPLFMVGIETDDAIHRDWVLSHMRPSALKTALKRTIAAQDHLGYRLEISAIREFVKGIGIYDLETNALEQSQVQVTENPPEPEDEYSLCLW